MTDPYHIVTDDDGHAYIIRKSDDERFERFVYDDVDDYDYFGGMMIGGSPTVVYFDDYEIIW